jgi:hypothetical protein
MDAIKCIFFLLLFTCFKPIFVQCQEVNTLNGVVIDTVSMSPISNVLVHNESKRTNILTDQTGHFSIKASIGDTLLFTNMAYEPLIYFVPENFNDADIQINLMVKLYDIGKVEIHSFGSYNDFKQKVLALKIEDKTINIKGLPKRTDKSPPKLDQRKYIESPLFLINSPISFFYYNFSKKEQSRLKFIDLELYKGKQKIIDQKFNHQVIKRITGIDDNKVIAFIVFCNFTNDYILKTSDYDLSLAIKLKYIEFRKLNKESKT